MKKRRPKFGPNTPGCSKAWKTIPSNARANAFPQSASARRKRTLREDDLWLYEEIEETGILPYEVYFFYLKLTVPDGETCGVLTIAADADGRAYILFLEGITPEIYENAQSGFRSY